MPRRSLRIVLGLATALSALPAMAENRAEADETSAAARAAAPLEVAFQDPPDAARPRVWWHWMNGNITKDGIRKDLEWMKRIGIGGLQNFDANLQTPQVVDHRLVYMTPEWKDAFRFAAHEADRLDLELAIASSPGWSETGGPWVKPQDGLKKLVWSETTLAPGKRFVGKLPSPPETTGPFQTLGLPLSIEEIISGKPEGAGGVTYGGQVGVIAFPVSDAGALPVPNASDGAGNPLSGKALIDADIAGGVTLAREEGKAPSLRLDYAHPVTARAATVFVPNIKVPFAGAAFIGALEASKDGVNWQPIERFDLANVPTTIGFAAVKAAHFRLVLNPREPDASLGSPAPGVATAGLFDGIARTMASQPLVVGQFQLRGEALVDRFETKAGFVMSRDYHALGGPKDGAKGIEPQNVVDLTEKLRPDGTLDWNAPPLPAGQHWRVLRLGYSLLGTTNHPAPPEATGLEVDKFDGNAVRNYLEHYIGMYKDAAGADMVGKRGVRAILTDSIEVGEANWTPRMLEQFQRLRGYDARPWLPALTGTIVGTRAQSDRFLYDYRRTLADLLASEHYGTVVKVAHENDLKVYGEALEDHRPMLGDDMAMRSHADVPMAALWTFDRKEGPRQTLIADMKGAASVAHLYGQNLVAAESMTAAMAPWAFAPKDLKRFIDLEFVSGVNRPIIHTSVHVPVDDKKPGLSLFIFGQYFNRQESWAELARPWMDYMARSSLLLQEGRNLADVAYFYGEEAPLTGLYGDEPVADAPIRYAYDFLNFNALTELLANDGQDVVAPSGARYKAIYLGGSSSHMTLAALRKLAALVEGGATVVGMAPIATPSNTGAQEGNLAEWSSLVARLWPGSDYARVGKGRVIASKDIEAALKTMGVATDFSFTGAEAGATIPFVHRRDDKGEIYYLVNQQEAAQSIEAHFRVTGKQPELWHPETGKSEPVSYRISGNETVVPLQLDGEEAVFVVFRKPAMKDAVTLVAQSQREIAALDGEWHVAFQADRGAPASIDLAQLEPLEKNVNPGVKYFSGIATYSRNFTLSGKWGKSRSLWLDLGKVGDLAQVSINGVDVGTAWHTPYRLDIGKAVRKGQNTLEIRVANTWVNRLIGDRQDGAQKITWTAMPTYRADAPLRPSGLIGPVRLMEQTDGAD
ncbi:glycosyl hydrolase [Novosphingobium pentaromativorans]|uniref:Glycoside hydrolase family protein n=1 Tax=Novosphingobium pentaromativorans US6-1 TaxID=1088721 RepID=G6EH17_9SPHN|nr:glycosyl hydrolase [Novosphingobium pentaromativorans]AIT81997.1 glycoside hydrolase [Novosphingobium pentaromativorans US6-1]EHJ59306.1 glycoside hydrolase family protein [Novosphingobium pentaromativorans US6-1]